MEAFSGTKGVQPYNHWKWHFFNSIKKFLSIRYFESSSTSFNHTIFSYMLYNFKWFEFSKHIANLLWRMNPKKLTTNIDNFHTDMTLWSARALYFLGPKKGLLSIQMLTSCNPQLGNFRNSFYIFLNQTYYKILWLHVSKNVFLPKIWYLYYKWLFRSIFWWKHSQRTVRFKENLKQCFNP